MTSLSTKVRTARLLGLPNVARVVLYRMALRLGLHPVQRIGAHVEHGPFFAARTLEPVAAACVDDWRDTARLFGFHEVRLGSGPPDWLANPLTGMRVPDPGRNWWEIPDFSRDVGDIKSVWEFSRLDWTIAFAQRARNGNAGSLERLNRWIEDWCTCNPPYRGPNWKCGQEASIRVLHLAMAALILRQEKTASVAVRSLVLAHLKRIAPTMSYAAAQDNNHATSEAAALFVGGSWLVANGDARATKYLRMGEAQLEKHVARLVDEEGGFSQYSLNYHRLLLDTLSMVEVWRRRLDLPPFSDRWQQRAQAATRWLASMTDPASGDGPNLGANDGARLLQLTPTPFRDFRPSVQLAASLFCGESMYEPGSHDGGLAWLGLTSPSQFAPPNRTQLFDQGGYAVLTRGRATAIVRYPRFRFRPSQADALHVDLWVDGESSLRDAGTYSYNGGDSWNGYFGGVGSHNSIQFDDVDQMPRISRFLLGDWISTLKCDPIEQEANSTRFSATYRDGVGRTHERRVSLSDVGLRVTDRVHGFARKAILRWRLAPRAWRIEGSAVTDGNHFLEVESSTPIVRFEIVAGFESRHYLEKTELPVLEIEIDHAGTLASNYRWVP